MSVQRRLPRGVLQAITAPSTKRGTALGDDAPSPTWLGFTEDVRLHTVFMVDTYHELARPYETMVAVVATLHQGGHVVVVEYKETAKRILTNHRMSKLQLLKEMSRFTSNEFATVPVLALVLCDVESLKFQFVCIFKKTATVAASGVDYATGHDDKADNGNIDGDQKQEL